MKARVSGIKTLGSFVAAAVVAMIPQMVQASGEQSGAAASTATAQSKEIASLKQQIYLCHHHKRHHRQACAPVAQAVKETVIEKPVIIEKVVEKQVFVDRPVVVEKQVAIVKPVEMQQQVIVEHSKHRRHLLHFGVPFIGVNLF